MGFTLNLSQFLDVAPQGSTGLSLAEEAIDDVIKRIEEEMEVLRPEEFAFAASISAGSFGGADSAPNLALHHRRAHEVTWKTLRGVREDLLTFQEACRKAKHEIIAADEDAAGRHRSTLDAVEVLAVGSSHGQGRRDHEQAQQGQDVTGGGDA